MSFGVVILAAGQGKRMASDLPKILHLLGGKPLLEHVVTTAQQLSKSQPLVVYGHQGEKVKNSLDHLNVRWIEQQEQLGTGHAVLKTLDAINEEHVLILYGDVPLISVKTLKRLVETTPKNAIGLLTAQLNHPTGYGRVKRNKQKKVIGIIEEKDANQKERAIQEINTGIYFVPVKYLKKWLPTLKNKNKQGEYYLTDIIHLAVKEKKAIHTIQPDLNEEILGINHLGQLASLERFYQRQYAERLMQQGLTICDPARIDIRGHVQVGRNVVIDINVILEGDVKIGDDCYIGPHTVLRNVVLGNHVEIKAHSVIDGVEIAAECVIGPFARLRPGTSLQKGVHIGNFVEVKNSEVDEGSKINHLSYVGDSEVGKRVNIGAGTITCNYDGMNKHKTIIGDDTHIGSDTQLVAPVTVGRGATIGAGSTIIKDVPPEQLTLSHKIEQRTVQDWQRPGKKDS